MIDVIYIGLTGLNGYQRGLRVIANDTSNLNTPGFKASTLQFASLFSQGGGLSGYGAGLSGYGLSTLGTRFDFKQGQFQSTGNGLDLAVDGEGLFVLRDAAGNLRYTRDGQFQLNSDGVLVSVTTGETVMAFRDGLLETIDISALRRNPPRATQTLTFSGNVSSGAAQASVGSVTVIDASGASHVLSVRLAAVTGTPGAWTVTLLEGTTEVGTGQISFVGGVPVAASARVAVTYTPTGQPPLNLTLDFSRNVTSYDSGSYSTITMQSQDGYAAGDLSDAAFDAKGVMTLTYTNGQKVTGATLALARFLSPDAVRAVGRNEFEATDLAAWQTGVAGQVGFGSVKAGQLEGSNVDLSGEFADLVIMQRGYQASSQVISTANEMINDLFALRGGK